MSRFIADVWALAYLGLDGKSVLIVDSADKSQELFRKTGINTAPTGKMSTKQATKKINAGTMKLGDNEVPFIVAYKRDSDTMLLHTEYYFETFAPEHKLPSVIKIEGCIYSNEQISELKTGMRNLVGKQVPTEKKQTQTTQSTKTKTTMTQAEPSVLIAQALEMMSKGGSVDESQVEAIVERKLKSVKPLKVEVVTAKSTKRVEKAHKNFADAVALVGLGKNVALIGEAGSGKSFGAIQMAQALNLDYVIESCHGKMQSFDLVGAMSPTTGNYISTKLRDAYENGKVLILDEFDRSNTETTIALNGILAGDCYGFPDGMVTRHEDFRVIACQNTFGTGTSKTYASAKAQDGSTLTRFTRIEWDIDSKLEKAICGDTEATRAVQSIRKNAKDNGYDQILITPRQAIDCNQMVDSLGWDLKKAIEFSCLNGLADDVKKRLLKEFITIS